MGLSQPEIDSWERKLRILVAQGEDCYITVLESIKKFDLPFRIEDGELKSKLSNGEIALSKFLTQDNQMLRLKHEAALISDTIYEVLISGETGTGKEIIAKAMIGKRIGQFKAVNCAGLPSELIESELFGSNKGAYTGADRTKNGLIADAKDGIMFMDEIGELPIEMQGKLLRVIQERKVRKVGSNSEEDINCKFVFATNRDLKLMVNEKLFRQDLFARVSTLILEITPLRERMNDCQIICESLNGGKEFWKKYGSQIMDGTLDVDLNVRSLQQYVVRYSVLGRVK